ncbi:insulinase family protein [Pseudomonas sp. GX19020]|uniref:M16 family metallopeptidase n=1 Tax=Pseudomonas sp. GX19020 TaxID=2942277 RepID=UPI0020192861|nr:pitrilysin family protein [Pseudomonas sp. GX19020]MCL4068717.1 insulinase family protein [Pseudomonas sp. GX19020]
MRLVTRLARKARGKTRGFARIMPALPLLAALSAFAAQAETVSAFRLENGLDVVVIEDHRAPVVVQMIWYRAGAADETAGKSGIAHFLEHLMFKGTDKVPAGQFSATVEAHGGDDNAFTSWDYTAYFQRIAADKLEMVMEMEADRMRGLKLDPAVVLTERQVILEERAQRTDSDPGALLGEQMRAALFLNHRYGVPIIGWRHEIAELTREDALAWYEKYYAPNNATLIIAGDVTPDQVKGLAEKYYGPIAPSEGIKPRIRPQEPPHLAERRLAYADERVSDPYVYRSYLAPERNPGDQKTAAALSILAELLGGNGQTAILPRALQFDSQVAVWSSAFYDGTALDDATFGLYVVPAPGVSLGEAEAAMDAVLAKFLEEGPDPEAFDRIKTQIRASDIYAKDDAMGLAKLYGEELSVGLGLDDIQSYTSVLDEVTIEDVMQAAHQVLNRNNAVTGWLERPPEASPEASPEQSAAPAEAAPGTEPATGETEAAE